MWSNADGMSTTVRCCALRSVAKRANLSDIVLMIRRTAGWEATAQ